MSIINITAELVYHTTTEEIYNTDYALMCNPDFNQDHDHVNISYTNPKEFRAHWQDEVKDVPIGELKKIIADAEEFGATHMGLFFHGDHGEYEVYAYNIHEETAEEFNARTFAENERKEKEKTDAKLKLIKSAKELGLTKIIIE